MKKLITFTFVIISLFFIVSGCSKKVIGKDLNSYESKNDLLSIYTTVYPLKYFSERIGGSYVDVNSVYPAGSDEHSFDPTQKDMMNLADSDIFFYVGLGLEGFVEKSKSSLKSQHVKLVSVSSDLPSELLSESEDGDEGDHNHGSTHNYEVDPHVWISPVLSIELAESIKNNLIESLPKHSEYFESNFKSLKEDLVELDDEYKLMGSSADNKSFLVSHASFGYISDTYGLEQLSLSGMNPQSEPSQKQLSNLVDYIKGKDLSYILYEQNVSSKLSEIIGDELGLEPLMLHNLSVLTLDDESNGEDYFSLMRANLKVFNKITK